MNGTEFGDWLHKMEKVSAALMSPLMKPLPEHDTIDLTVSESHYQGRSHDINPNPGLIAPTLNLTNHHPGGTAPDPDVVGLFGFGGGIVGDLESNAYDANLGEIGDNKRTDSEMARKTFHLDRFNAIGEDYIEGVGNVGNIYNNKEDDDSEEEAAYPDTNEVMITDAGDADAGGLRSAKNYFQSRLFGGEKINTNVDLTSTMTSTHHSHRHAVPSNSQQRHHYNTQTGQSTSSCVASSVFFFCTVRYICTAY